MTDREFNQSSVRDRLARELWDLVPRGVPLVSQNVDALINVFYGRGAVNNSGSFTDYERHLITTHFSVYEREDGSFDPQAAVDINNYLAGVGFGDLTFSFDPADFDGVNDIVFDRNWPNDATNTSGTPNVPAPDSAAPTDPFDFRSEATLLYPEWPPELIDFYVDEFARIGDANLARRSLQNHPNYDSYFPGNRRPDGTLRMTEQGYLEKIEGFKRSLTARNLNWELFEGRFTDLIEGDVSVVEFDDRVNALHRMVVDRAPAVAALFAEHRGVDGLTPEAILASVLDPTISDAVLNQEIEVAQIRASGARHGFNMGFQGIQGYVRRGLNASDAAGLFAAAEFVLPNLGGAARRQGTEIDVDTMLGSATGDVDARRTIGRVTATELAANVGQSRLRSLRTR